MKEKRKKGTAKEFAKLVKIPVFRAGTHSDKDRSTFSEAELDEIVEMSNAAQPLIQASIQAGKYPEGNDLTLTKPIPGVINLHHQKYLSDTLKEAVRGAKMHFEKAIFDGVEWVCATFEDVRQDVAEFLQAKFPFRSVEILPTLFDPESGKTFRNVIRSVGFLDPDTLPAVSGQSPLLPIEFTAGETPVKTIVSCVNHEPKTPKREGKRMPEEIEKEGVQTPPSVDLKEFEALENKVKEMASKNATLETALKVEREAREAGEIREFCAVLTRDYGLSPAGLAVITPLLTNADNVTVKEFADVKQTDRQAVMSAVKELTRMAKDGSLLVFAGEFAPQTTNPLQPKNPADVRMAKIKEFEAAAKEKAHDPKDEKEVYRLAYGMALDKYGDAL